MLWLALAAVGLLWVGWWVMRRATAAQRQTGLPQGRLIYADTHGHPWRPPPRPLYSAAHNLVGKPDYLVETGAGVIPVEVKSSVAPSVPYLGHLLQVAAYCLLVEETMGHTPPHGWLKYTDALYEVDFTRELRAELLATMEEMRLAWPAEDVPRSHNQPGKCAACSFRTICDDALV